MSMKTYRFFHHETGIIHPVSFACTDDAMLAPNTPPDHLAIEGHIDPRCHRIDPESKEVIDVTPPPPSTDHVWNPDAKRFDLTAAGALRRSTLKRIAELEATQPRCLREAVLGIPGALDRLRDLDRQIGELRKRLPP